MPQPAGHAQSPAGGLSSPRAGWAERRGRKRRSTPAAPRQVQASRASSTRLQYDSYPRKSLVDHWYDDDVSLAAVARGEAIERGDFLGLPFEAKLRRNPKRIQVQLTRQGNAWGVPLKITKGVTLEAGSDVLEIAYLIEGLPPERTMHFGVEFNFAGMPAGADDRFFHTAPTSHNNGNALRLGRLESRLDLADAEDFGLTDEWLGIDVGLSFSRPTNIWTYPIETVSQSEGGFELVHQSVCRHSSLARSRRRRRPLERQDAVSHRH